jgi:nitroreductase
MLDECLGCFDAFEGLTDAKVRLLPMEDKAVESAMTGIIGNYGMMKNAPVWVIGLSDESDYYKENFGFRMERFILECTRKGLGTCWIGGFFRMSDLERLVPKQPDEYIVCISPVGYATHRRLIERSLRVIGGLNTRRSLAERVFAERWGSSAAALIEANRPLSEVLECARWSPSASNRQPCHYILHERSIIITLLKSLNGTYPSIITKGNNMGGYFQPIDAGIAMLHLHLAAREKGMPGKWSLKFDEKSLRDRCALPDDARIVAEFRY